jgi:hypothetical protein
MLRKLVVIGLAPTSLAVAIFACSASRVPVPEYKPHPKHAAEAMCVPYPPPAPKPEETGLPPESMSKRAVWVDGEWVWHPRGGPPGAMLGRWEWKKGGWVEPPYGATYSRGEVDRMANGALAFYPPHWHLPDHYKETYAAASGGSSAAPVSSEGLPLDCPAPPKHDVLGSMTSIHDAGEEAHVGPALVYPADAPSSAPPKVQLDAEIPSDGAVPPKLIEPPPGPSGL